MVSSVQYVNKNQDGVCATVYTLCDVEKIASPLFPLI